MKRFCITMLLLLACATAGTAAEKSVEAPADCKHCGMNRTKFAHSRMLVTYSDAAVGTCSLNCAVVELKEGQGKVVKALQVADYNSKKLLDAKTAVWVIGGKKKGVMTAVAKWAFADKSRAEKFIIENGGKLATFDEARKAAESEQEESGKGKGHGKHKM